MPKRQVFKTGFEMGFFDAFDDIQIHVGFVSGWVLIQWNLTRSNLLGQS